MNAGVNRSQAFPPRAKVPRLVGPSSFRVAVGDCSQYVGDEFLIQFPEAKSVLNNALQAHLLQLNKKLEYISKRVLLPDGREISRCTLHVPYPEPFSVVGEGPKAKDAERRAAAVACSKLKERGVLQLGTNLANKLSKVEEDKKPRSVELSMVEQMELFDAVSCLSNCQSFSRWNAVSLCFQRTACKPFQILPRSHQSKEYQLTVLPANGDIQLPLPPSLQVSIPPPTMKDKDLSLGSISCPCCRQLLNVYIGSTSELQSTITATNSPLLPLPTSSSATSIPLCKVEDNSNVVQSPESVICAFSGTPYAALPVDQCQERNWSLQKRQEAIETRYQSSPPDSAICVARKLPIAASRNVIVTEINSSQVVIISGATGSGKTTQTPQYILENYIMYGVGANCNIIVTQPRRISAISNAERVAEERGEKVGDSVGYQVRMELCVPPSPGRVLYCTTGVLLTKLRSNPQLHGVSHVIVDEVHERDVNTDFLLIFLSNMIKEGLPIKIVLMSASIDVDILAEYFRRAGVKKVPCLSVEGRLYPVTSYYLEDVTRMIGWNRGIGAEEPEADIDLVSAVVVHVVKTTPDGAVLVFLPGWDDITSLQDQLQAKLSHLGRKFVVYPLHSMISVGDQQRVFKATPVGVRKIVLATNIAETSVTINDVVWVINTGTVKVKTFDPVKRASCLDVKWCSKASTVQRSGRAGRCQPGHCFHLFTRRLHSLMEEYELPEMHRVPLEEIVLQAKIMKPRHKAAQFLAKALTPPPLNAAAVAVKALTDLGALNNEEELTWLGRMLALLPVDPKIGRLILYGVVFRTLNPILTIAASYGYKDPFVCPPLKRKEADEARLRLSDGCCSDHILINRAYNGWRSSIDNNQESGFVRDNFLHRGTLSMIHGIRKQFVFQLRSFGFDVDSDVLNQFSDSEAMLRAVLTAGLFPNVVKVAKMMESGGTRGNYVKKRVRNGCQTLQDGRVFMHPSSVNADSLLSSAWFVYFEKVKTSKVHVRDSTLVHSLHMLLFGGNTLDVTGQSDGHAVARIDGVDMFGFLLEPQLADLLVCTREGIRSVLESTLANKLSDSAVKQPPPHDSFLIALNKFLCHTAV